MAEGDNIFSEFTANNIGNSVAIVFNQKVIVHAIILHQLNNTINFSIQDSQKKQLYLGL